MEQQKDASEATVDVVMAVLVQNFRIRAEAMEPVARAVSDSLLGRATAAVLAERERCAALVERICDYTGGHGEPARPSPSAIAAAIRKGGR